MSLCEMLCIHMYALGGVLEHATFCAAEWMALIVMPLDIYITNLPCVHPGARRY